MLRGIWAAALLVGAMAGQAMAGDEAIPLGRYQPKSGGFGGGVVSNPALASATASESADDTDLVHWRRGFYGYGGWYRPYYGGFYTGFYRPYYGYGYGYGYAGFYRPGFAVSFYSYPRYYYPYYSSFYYGAGYYNPYWGFCAGGGTTPTVTLGQPAPTAPQYTIPKSDSYRYDGNPSLPTPTPVPDRSPAPDRIEPAQDNTLSIKLVGKTAPAPATRTVYRYPAFGEK